MDYENDVFKLAHQVPNISTPYPVPAPCIETDSGLGATQKGLIAVGTVLGVLIVAAIVGYPLYLFLRRRAAQTDGAGDGGDGVELVPPNDGHQLPEGQQHGGQQGGGEQGGGEQGGGEGGGGEDGPNEHRPSTDSDERPPGPIIPGTV